MVHRLCVVPWAYPVPPFVGFAPDASMPCFPNGPHDALFYSHRLLNGLACVGVWEQWSWDVHNGGVDFVSATQERQVVWFGRSEFLP